MTLALHLTPQGHLRLVAQAGAAPLPAELTQRLTAAFAAGAGHGLLHLGATEVATVLPPAWAFWRDFAVRYVTALTATPQGEAITVTAPDALTLETLCLDAPPMTGAEYLTPAVFLALWSDIETAVQEEMAASNQSLQDFLKARHPAWNLVGRVHFNLAENHKDPEYPFAFLATYTSRLSTHGKAQHLPLSQALAEFSGGKKKAQLLSLLVPVQKAAETCDWLADMVETGEIYHPLRWQVPEAVRFLKDVPRLETAGIVVRMPKTWRSDRPARPKISATVGKTHPAMLGMDALLDFHMEVTLEGEPLTPAQIRNLLKSSDGLQWIRGQWVEVDRDRLAQLITRFQEIEQAAAEGLPLGQAMRLLAGASLDEHTATDPAWSEVVAGKWLAETLQALRSPEGLAAVDPGPQLKARLRPYQQAGVRWLHLLTRLGLGACLADDMGLGKTLAETIAAKQEKLLVFTQFRETTAPLAAFLGSIFGREGLVLHGGTPVGKRRELVKRFQEDELIPFFVLSLKAGGSGLNLTAASHVIHFDRWWNPAVENQATDRAYRIGQHRNVLVHKFVCRGTIEERIDQLIATKQQLVKDVLEDDGEINLTELSDAQLLDLVKLDIHAVEE